MSTPSIAERVAAGVQWLDKHVPDWLAGIDLERLSLRNSCNCILGQTFGDYWDAPLIDEGADAYGGGQPVRLGFNVTGSSKHARNERFAALEAEWRRVIQERRQAAGEAS